MTTRFSRHDASSQARYQEVKRLANTQDRILAGTPGTLKTRTRRGTSYWVREYIRVDGRKADEHLGTVASLGPAAVQETRDRIQVAQALAAGSSTLRLLGYQRVDRKTAAVLAVLCNHGLFRAGLVLVGSHAYGALLNELGIAAPGYLTRDIDVARGTALSIALPSGSDLLTVLRESGLGFNAVPGLPSHRPSASFKLAGADALAVDLLAPGKKLGESVPVPELGAHAQAAPHLETLVAEPIDAVILSPNQLVPVRVPSPERFVLHKLFTAQSRHADRDKVRKDLEQAAVIAAAVEEDMPGRLLECFRTLPETTRGGISRGARAAAILKTPPPRLAEGASVLQALLDERAQGR